jgi:hypothetical protein
VFLEEDDLRKVLNREKLTLDDVKAVLRSVRYNEQHTQIIASANSLLREAGDYLPSHTLRALVRADVTVNEAALCLERNKAFFFRLVELLPSLIGFFNRRGNLWGITSCIDDCHNDFHATAISPRKDRQLRETRESLTRALETAVAAAAAIEEAKRHIDIEFDRYRAIYYPNIERQRSLDELIDELRLCSGVLEIVNATVDLNPKSLILSGNDKRTTVVQYAYHMSTMWDGPKLVTTPGSHFSSLCSLLFEAVSGEAEESLSGATNRYARSAERKQWDEEGEQEELDDNDNFVVEKRTMRVSIQEIELCKAALRTAQLSNTAKQLLLIRVKAEQRKFEEARTTYGPRQVLIGQLNPAQLENMFADAINRVSPEKFERSLDDLDISLGRLRRSRNGQAFDG